MFNFRLLLMLCFRAYCDIPKHTPPHLPRTLFLPAAPVHEHDHERVGQTMSAALLSFVSHSAQWWSIAYFLSNAIRGAAGKDARCRGTCSRASYTDQRGTFHRMLLSVVGPLLNYGDKPGHQQAGKFSVAKCDACFMYATVQVHCVLAPHLGCNHVI